MNGLIVAIAAAEEAALAREILSPRAEPRKTVQFASENQIWIVEDDGVGLMLVMQRLQLRLSMFGIHFGILLLRGTLLGLRSLCSNRGL